MQEADVGAAKKVFDLDLPELGPYNLTFTRSGRHMLLGGRKGHLALMEWQQRHLVCEVQVCTAFEPENLLHGAMLSPTIPCCACSQVCNPWAYQRCSRRLHLDTS